MTTPALVTVAIDVLLLAHVPPVVGLTVVVAPAQMVLTPVIVTVGKAFTVTIPVGFDTHPEDEVNVNVAVPTIIPVTIPALLTDATAGLLLAHVPPLVGLNVVVVAGHIEELPVMDAGWPLVTLI